MGNKIKTKRNSDDKKSEKLGENAKDEENNSSSSNAKENINLASKEFIKGIFIYVSRFQLNARTFNSRI